MGYVWDTTTAGISLSGDTINEAWRYFEKNLLTRFIWFGAGLHEDFPGWRIASAQVYVTGKFLFACFCFYSGIAVELRTL